MEQGQELRSSRKNQTQTNTHWGPGPVRRPELHALLRKESDRGAFAVPSGRKSSGMRTFMRNVEYCKTRTPREDKNGSDVDSRRTISDPKWENPTQGPTPLVPGSATLSFL